MARNRSKKHEVEQPRNRSTASVFADQSGLEPTTTASPSATAAAPATPTTSTPETAAFPLNHLNAFQEFIGQNLDFCKFIELLVVSYIAEIYYLFYQDKMLGRDVAMIGFNCFGVLLGLFVSYKSASNKFKRDPSKFVKPNLPEFNLIYAVLIPLAFGILLKSKFLIVNLALNYSLLLSLHPLARMASSIMFYEVYNEDKSLSTVWFIAVAMSHYLFTSMIDTINQGDDDTETTLPQDVIEQDRENIRSGLVHDGGLKSGNNVTLTKTEIQLLSVFLINLLLNFQGDHTQSNHLPVVIFQKLIVSLIGSSIATYPVFKLYQFMDHNKLLAVTSALVFGAVFYFATVAQLTSVLHHPNALLWLWHYVTDSNTIRPSIIINWCLMLVLAIPSVWFMLGSHLSLNSRRKIWHYLLLLSISYPALIAEPQFTTLSLLGSIIVFCLLEMVRYNRFTMVGKWLYDQLQFCQDFKDLKGPLNLSYIFLVLGVSLPLVYDTVFSNGDGNPTYKSFIGILSLGVGDSAASIVGKKWGSIKWKHGTKSAQGTVAFIVSTSLSFAIVNYTILPPSSQVTNWENLLISCLLGGIVEGVSTLNDNFLIPCLMVITLEILNLKFP